MALFWRFFYVTVTVIEFHFIRFWREYTIMLAALFLALPIFYFIYVTPPRDFPVGAIVTIPEGAALPEIAELLGEKRIIKYPVLFSALVRVTGSADRLIAGPYLFENEISVFSVVKRITRGMFDILPSRITFPEGTTVRQMSALVAQAFPSITGEDFVKLASSYEGYLFPDTYVFPADSTSKSIVKTMRKSFDDHMKEIEENIAASTYPIGDIITMASIIEGETNDASDRPVIAGILWKRIEMGMPLQVDVVFGYILGKSGYAPSLADLKIDSPYNTYTNKGLPPGPINNPGLDAILAALAPKKTEYLFYLTGFDGEMHYAKTFAGHKINRQKYLK